MDLLTQRLDVQKKTVWMLLWITFRIKYSGHDLAKSCPFLYENISSMHPGIVKSPFCLIIFNDSRKSSTYRKSGSIDRKGVIDFFLLWTLEANFSTTSLKSL